MHGKDTIFIGTLKSVDCLFEMTVTGKPWSVEPSFTVPTYAFVMQNIDTV